MCDVIEMHGKMYKLSINDLEVDEYELEGYRYYRES